MSNLDIVYSSALGTSSRHEFSATHIRGFMALGPATRAAIDNTPPPLSHWTKDNLQVLRVQGLFSLTCNMECEPSVLGPSLVLLLLQNIFRRNEKIPLAELQATKCPETLKGHINLSSLVENLATRESFTNPFTFSRARKLIKESGKDVSECLKAGFLEMKLRWFPDLKFRDLRGTCWATWNFVDFVEVHNDDKEPSIEARSSALVEDIAMEMERRSICYARNLEKYREHGMPWLIHVLKRVPGTIDASTHKKILVLVSSVGLLMNRDFVCYDKIKDLLMELKVSQADLQKWKIMSTSVCDRTFGFTLHKLHYDIPYRMVHHPVTSKKKPPTLLLEQDPVEVPVELEDEEPDTVITRTVFMPANVSRQWSEEELLFVKTDPSVRVKDIYRQYVQGCRHGRPVIPGICP